MVGNTLTTKTVQEIQKVSILHIISGDIWAGAEVQVYNILRELKKREIPITCILFNDGILKDKLVVEAIDTIVFNEDVHNSPVLLCKIIKQIHKSQPRIVHVHAAKEHFLGKIATHLCFKQISLIRTVHGATKAWTWNELSFRKIIRAKFVVYLDNLLKTRFSDALIAVSKDLERDLLSKHIKGNVFQIYNAINTKNENMVYDKNRIRKKYGTQNCFWVGTATRLIETKNLPMLIKAGKILDEQGINIRISIFGDGPLRAILRDFIESQNLSERVKLHGFKRNIYPIIKSLDAFVLCSKHEGLPMALLEAMFAKTPIVCTSVGGMKEVITDGVDGILVQSNDFQNLARAIARLKEQRKWASSLAEHARSVLDEKLSLSKTTDQLLEVYYKFKNDNLSKIS